MKKTYCDQQCEYLTLSEEEQDLRRTHGVRGKSPHKCMYLTEIPHWAVLRHDSQNKKELIAARQCYKRAVQRGKEETENKPQGKTIEKIQLQSVSMTSNGIGIAGIIKDEKIYTCADCKDVDNPECKKAIKFDVNNAKYPCESFRMQK